MVMRDDGPIYFKIKGSFINNGDTGIYLGNVDNEIFAIDAHFLYEYWKIHRFPRQYGDNFLSVWIDNKKSPDSRQIKLGYLSSYPSKILANNNRYVSVKFHHSFYTFLENLDLPTPFYMSVKHE